MNAWAVGAALLLAACDRAPGRSSLGEAPAVAAIAPQREGGASRERKIAEVTPEIAAKASEILRANPGAQLGAEFPFAIAGRSYVARVEEHDNPEGDPDRPPGRHKGITVYSTD